MQELNSIDFEFEDDFESESLSMMSLDSLESLLNDNESISYSVLDLQRMADDIDGDSYQLETLVVILGSKSLKERVMEFDALYNAIKNCLASNDIAVQQFCFSIFLVFVFCLQLKTNHCLFFLFTELLKKYYHNGKLHQNITRNTFSLFF